MIDLEEDVTVVYNQHVCHICQKFFTQPKVLPCQHYFCESCLTEYLQCRLDAFESGCFPCPLCNVITPAPDHKLNQIHWPRLFPSVDTDVIIKEGEHGVSHDCQLCKQRYRPRKSLFDYGIWCDTCHLSMCAGCEEQHRKQLDDHVYMPIIDSSKARNKLNYRRACSIHRDAFNDYYCPTCRLSICTHCVKKYHYYCQEIDVICEDLSDIIPKTMLGSTQNLYSSPFKRLESHDPNNVFKLTETDSVKPHPFTSASVAVRPIRSIITIATRLPHDISPSLCEDIVVMTTNGIATIIIADINNNCLKVFNNNMDTTDGTLHMKLPSKPYRVTELGNDHIATTLPLTAQIVIIKVLPELDVKSTIKTKKRYSGIAGLTNHRLLVCTAWSSPVSMDIINSSGEILISVVEDNMGRSLLAASMTYINQTPTGDILVSDWSMETITCLTPDLTSVNWKYRDVAHRLDHPLGFDCDRYGQIFVADLEGNCVVELSALGEFKRNIITGVEKPKAVAIDNRGKLYILLENGSIKIVSF